MQDITFTQYNTLLNELNKEADAMYSIALSFKSAGMEGFAGFMFNESGERWHYGKKLACYVISSWKSPIIDATPKPPNGFPNPAEALTAAENMDKNIIRLLEAGIKQAVANDPAEVYKMSKYLHKLRHEHNEIMNVRKKLALPGANIAEIDEMLIEKYGNPCGRK